MQHRVDQCIAPTTCGEHRGLDDKGRFPVGVLTDRELLEELVLWTRTTSDSLERLVEGMKSNPMLRTMGIKF